MTYNKWVVVGCLVACGAMTTVVAQDDLDALLKDLGGAKPAAKQEAKPAEDPKAAEKPVEVAKPAEEAKPAEAVKEEAKPAEQMAAPAAVVEAPKAEEKPAEAVKVEAPKAEEKPVEMAKPAEEAKPAEAVKEEAKPAEQMAAPAAVVEALKEEAKPAEQMAAPAAVVEAPKAEEKPVEAVKVEAPKAEEKPVEMAKPAEEAKPAEAVKEEAKPAEQMAAPAAVVEAPKADAPKVEEVKPVVAEKPNPDAELISEVVTLERIRRQALDDHGTKALEKARKAVRDGDYATARDQYQQALEFIVNRPANDAARKEAADGITEAYYSEARLLLKQGDKDRARLMAEESLKRGHPYAARLIETIRREPLRTELDNSSITHRVNDRDYKENRDEIRRRLRRARQFFTTAEYAKAQEECEIVLRDYPDNAEAIELRERIGTRLKTVADSEFAATRSLMIAGVREAWTPDRYAAESAQLPKGKSEMTEKKEVSRLSDTKTDEQVVAKKLREIVIPEVSFRPPATIIDAVDFFKQASRDYDNPETPVDQRGVNLVLKLGGVAAAAPAADAAPAAAGGAAADPFAAAASDTSSSGAPVIQAMSARFISLYDALKLVCDVTGMKFRIRGNIVMIVPSNDPDSVLISRSYNVLPSLIERMGAVTSELSNNAPKQDGGAFVVKDMGEKSTEDSLKTFFGQMGVSWPQGASISYLSAISKLRVTNTSDELVKFEQILEDLNVTPRLIEIEARFVEVSQKDLNSLGFEWLMNGDFNFNAGKWGPLSHSASTGDGLFGSGSGAGSRDNNMSINGVNGTDYSTGTRYLSTTGNPIAGNGNSINDKFMKVNAVFGNADLSMILHMLSQRSDTDLLSAPKVVTKPGLEAVMKVVTEYIYPTEFNVQISQQSNSGGSLTGGGSSDPIAIVEPQNFSMREVGIILQVLPTVSSDGQMIDLVLKPQVVSEPVWKNYGTRLPKQVQKSLWDEITKAFIPTYVTEYIELPMEQPFFNVRSVETQISIYNGATVVMGGLITESRKTMEDKVPLLGDIPYLGRLFQSKSEESDKRNLLVFVTARLVDPAGRTVKATGESALNAVAAPAAPAVPAQGGAGTPEKKAE